MSDQTSGRTLDDYERQHIIGLIEAPFRGRNGLIEPIGPDDDIVYLRVVSPACGCASHLPAHKKRGKNGDWKCDRCFR